MTDERIANVLPFQRPKRKGPPLPISAADFRCEAYLNEGIDDPRPVALALEFRGERIGALGAYPNTEEGMAAAREAARLAVLVIDLIALTPPPGGPAA